MAMIVLTFAPHLFNEGSGNLFYSVDADAEIPVPEIPGTATPGTQPGTVVASSLLPGDRALLGRTVHELVAIDLNPE